MNYKYPLAAACVLLIAIFIFRPKPDPKLHSTITVTERQDSAMVTIDKTSPNLHFRSRLRKRDNALGMDTIIDRDTVCVYIEPDSTIEIRLLPAPRIVQEWVNFTRRDSIIYQRATEFMERPWYESPLLVVVGAMLGFLIAMFV